MNNNNIFNHMYSLEQLIDFFAKNNDNKYFLDTKLGIISAYNCQNLNPEHQFIFKPIEKTYALSKVSFNEELSLEEALKQKGKNKRDIYNFIKSEVISFLSENKILPPSLNPILSFKEKDLNNKIIIEIS